MIRKMLIAVSFLLMLQCNIPAEAQSEGIWLQPFSANWGWGCSPLKGNVSRIIQNFQSPVGRTEKLSEGFKSEFNYKYQNNKLASETNGYVDSDNLFYTATFDANQRRVKVVYTGTFNNVPNVTSTETVHYNADGKVTEFTVSRSNGEKLRTSVENKAADDGGNILTWDFSNGRQIEHYTITFNKSQQLTHYLLNFNSQKVNDITFAYNEHGDVVSADDSHDSKSFKLYEYEYDTHGNWTRQTQYLRTSDNGGKKLVALYTRQLTYLPHGGRSSASQPAVAQKENGSVIGTYKATTGDPKQAGFYSIMVLELKQDGTMTLINTMPDVANPGKTIDNKTEGTWTQTGNSITVTIEKANGNPVAADDPKKTLNLTVADGNKKLTNEHLPEFARQ
jgi:hypothetical protein